MCVSPYFGLGHGWGGGSPNNPLMQFFTLGGSKVEVFETYFCDTVIT